MEPIGMPEKRAVAWDRLVTVVIVVLLFFPLPFVRFQAMPQLVTILERPILPWSEFEIRYVSYPQGVPQSLNYGFTWKGMLVPKTDPESPPQRGAVFPITPVNEPLLRWQSNPEIRLGELFVHGEVLKVSSFWQPLLFYPLHIGWQARLN
jgi:hypothetical protein